VIGHAFLIESIGRAHNLDQSNGTTHVTLRPTTPICMMVGVMTTETQDAAMRVRGVPNTVVTTDSALEWHPSDIAPEAASRRVEIMANRRSAANGSR
jgi:metal-sulfur cluster biosynthetic enzyme